MKQKTISNKNKKIEKGALTPIERVFFEDFKRENRELLKTLSKL